jgi:hypothetical protein
MVESRTRHKDLLNKKVSVLLYFLLTQIASFFSIYEKIIKNLNYYNLSQGQCPPHVHLKVGEKRV